MNNMNALVCLVLCLVLVGFLGLAVLAVLGLVFPIVAAIKTKDGQVGTYALCFTFVKA